MSDQKSTKKKSQTNVKTPEETLKEDSETEQPDSASKNTKIHYPNGYVARIP